MLRNSLDIKLGTFQDHLLLLWSRSVMIKCNSCFRLFAHRFSLVFSIILKIFHYWRSGHLSIMLVTPLINCDFTFYTKYNLITNFSFIIEWFVIYLSKEFKYN